MKPIPTMNAMKPAPGKGVSSFPTPVIKDTVIVEVVNAWKGDYQPLEYGAKWDDVPHASVQGSFPDHKLISQAPNSEDGQWVKRIWANDRVDQDTYNYAIKYSGGSDAHPIYIRTYLLPRETYQPVPDLSPDPLFPGALLVDEEVARTEGEFDSRYVQVTRVYETLPGPIISSKRYNERGDLETINVQQVHPDTIPDPDGLFVTQSQVVKEDVSKGTKTTATVEQYSTFLGGESKSGLLGKTSITETIVSPSTSADNLTFTGTGGVIESSIQPISASKAKKVTVTSSGPVSLESQSLVDSPLGLVEADVTKSIVDPSETPQGSLTTIRDNIEALDTVKSQREKIVANEWPTNSGVDYDEQLGVGIYYTETIKPPSEYLNPTAWTDLSYKNYKPLDQWKSLERAYDMDKIDQVFENQYYQIPTRVNVKLPDRLKSVTAYFGRGFGEGKGSGGDQGASTGSYSRAIDESYKTSESVNGDIYFEVEAGYNGPVDGLIHIFFLKIQDGRVQQQDILSKLNQLAGETSPSSGGGGGGESAVITKQANYQNWPYIKTKTENLVVISGSKSKTFSRSRSQNVNINGFAQSVSESDSFDVDVNVRSVNIPTTIHPAITIGKDYTGPIGNLGVESDVKPATISATEPSIFPLGDFLYDASVEIYKYGYVKVTATTVVITADETGYVPPPSPFPLNP